MEESTNLGIFIFNPIREAKEVTSIGPKNHAKGILKSSAINALGIDIKTTKKNCFENI